MPQLITHQIRYKTKSQNTYKTATFRVDSCVNLMTEDFIYNDMIISIIYDG